MKKWLKRIGIGLLALLALAALAITVRFYVMLPRSRPPVDVKAPNDATTIERGRYLAQHVTACVGCHSKVDSTQPGEPLVEGHVGEGRDFGDLPGFPGRVRAQNITPDRETGLGAWSDGEILRAMREGVSRDGRPLFPMMPYKTYGAALSDADALAIIAYLRTLPPIKNQPGPMQVDFPVSMFVRAAPAPVAQAAGAPPEDGVPRGLWLLKVASCNDCHDSVDARRQPIPGKALAGGQPFPIPGKGTVYSANITSDIATGIGSYSDEDLMRALSEGVGKSGRPLYGMPWPYYKGMIERDKRALIAALRTIAPIQNAVPPKTFQP